MLKILDAINNRFQTSNFSKLSKIFYTQNWPENSKEITNYGINELNSILNDYNKRQNRQIIDVSNFSV